LHTGRPCTGAFLRRADAHACMQAPWLGRSSIFNASVRTALSRRFYRTLRVSWEGCERGEVKVTRNPRRTPSSDRHATAPMSHVERSLHDDAPSEKRSLPARNGRARTCGGKAPRLAAGNVWSMLRIRLGKRVRKRFEKSFRLGRLVSGARARPTGRRSRRLWLSRPRPG
jgi:hypothetical protein